MVGAMNAWYPIAIVGVMILAGGICVLLDIRGFGARFVARQGRLQSFSWPWSDASPSHIYLGHPRLSRVVLGLVAVVIGATWVVGALYKLLV
jgi:hypothetical protein